MRILLADDQPNVRSALRLLLEQEAGISVTAEVSDSKELLGSLEKDCPDLVLLDWELPGGTGAELVAALRSQCPELVIIAMSSRPEARQAALKVGADSFVSKGSLPQEVIAAIRIHRKLNPNLKEEGNGDSGDHRW